MEDAESGNGPGRSRCTRQAEAGRLQEAEETAQLWEILCGVLDQFVEILGEEHHGTETSSSRLFRLVLTQYSVGTIPVSLDQVSVSEITRNDRHTTSYLFLLGANDHVLPDPGQSGGLLNEDDRQALALRGVELAPTGMERMGIELQNLYAALAQPTGGPDGELSGDGCFRQRTAPRVCGGAAAETIPGAVCGTRAS